MKYSMLVYLFRKRFTWVWRRRLPRWFDIFIDRALVYFPRILFFLQIIPMVVACFKMVHPLCVWAKHCKRLYYWLCYKINKPYLAFGLVIVIAVTKRTYNVALLSLYISLTEKLLLYSFTPAQVNGKRLCRMTTNGGRGKSTNENKRELSKDVISLFIYWVEGLEFAYKPLTW